MVKIPLILRDIVHGILAIVITVMLSACSTDTTAKKMHYKTYALGSEPVRNLDVKFRIMDQYVEWKGVRYRFGGSTKKGIDCSAFVQRTFREQFGLELPRSTYRQKKIGKSISRSSLRTGDLVLFRAASSGSTSRHVGIYIGNDRFVHASTSNGVMISSMNEPYWKKRYTEARRVLSLSSNDFDYPLIKSDI